MKKLIVNGAQQLYGEVCIGGAKNAAVAIIPATVLARGCCVLENVPDIHDTELLFSMLRAMGATVEKKSRTSVVIDTSTLTESVVPYELAKHMRASYYFIGSLLGRFGQACVSMPGGCNFGVRPIDQHIKGFEMLGAEIRIENVRLTDMRMIRMIFEKLGIRIIPDGSAIIVPADQEMRIRSDLHNAIPQIYDAPWPAYPTDLMSIAITTATQCEGTVIFFEKMFEGRMFFVDSLVAMGAQIILCDPHRVVVVGKSQLYGTRLESPDVRAGMSLLIAALTAQGQSTIYNVRQIDRGYERVDEKLRALGAKIEREHID